MVTYDVQWGIVGKIIIYGKWLVEFSLSGPVYCSETYLGIQLSPLDGGNCELIASNESLFSSVCKLGLFCRK